MLRAKAVAPLLGAHIASSTVGVPGSELGRLKQALVKAGWPAEDRAGFVDGASLPIVVGGPEVFSLRSYKRQALQAFFSAAGSGVVVLPAAPARPWWGSAPWPPLEPTP